MIERHVANPIYHKSVADVLADETVSPEKRERLERLRTALRLDEEKAAESVFMDFLLWHKRCR
jgi:hypothetical protein